MGMFVFLPLVLPLTAWPIARLAEQHLHPWTATRLLTGMAAHFGVLCLIFATTTVISSSIKPDRERITSSMSRSAISWGFSVSSSRIFRLIHNSGFSM